MQIVMTEINQYKRLMLKEYNGIINYIYSVVRQGNKNTKQLNSLNKLLKKGYCIHACIFNIR